MRIRHDPPVSAQPPTAGLVVAVLQAPPRLIVESRRSLAGLVVFSGQGQLRIETDEGVFVLRGTLGLSPGTQVVLTPEHGEDGIVARLHRTSATPRKGDPTPAPNVLRLMEPSDRSEINPPPANIIGQRLSIRVLAADAGASMPLHFRTSEPSPAFRGDAAIRIIGIIGPSPPAAPSETDIPTRSAQTFEAIVAAKRADGTIVRTDDGSVLLLPPNVELSEGTRIAFIFEPAPTIPGAPRVENPFQVIEALMQLLGRGGAANGRSSIARLLPRPDKALPALAAAFLGALKNGDLSAWLGSKADARLAQASPELHDRLAAAWSNARAGEAEAQEPWQTWTIPVLTETGLSALRIHCRRQGRDAQGGAGEDGEATVRVIFECTFTRTGRVQVDTLCRKPRRCDVLIRTEAPLTPSVRDAVSLAYADAAAAIGLVGKLGFRAAKGAYIEPASVSSTPGRLSLNV